MSECFLTKGRTIIGGKSDDADTVLNRLKENGEQEREKNSEEESAV